MASKKNLTKKGKSVNNNLETNPKGAGKTDISIPKGNAIGDRLWLEHFANALHGKVFDDEQYRTLLRLIDRELSSRYKGKL